MSNYRVWHIPQVPGEAFYIQVDSPVSGRWMIDTLAEYDQFQFDQGIKPDYTNASGLEFRDGNEWVEWEDDDGQSITETEEV